MTDIAAGYERYFTLAKKCSEWFHASPLKDMYLSRTRFVARTCILSGA
jgi:hypothetical protein